MSTTTKNVANFLWRRNCKKKGPQMPDVGAKMDAQMSERVSSGSLHDWLARERIYYQDGLVTSD